MSKKIPFYVPSINDTELKEIKEVLALCEESKVDKLERDFAKYIGCEYALTTSSGTGALHLAMTAIDLKRGDKIICSVNAFPSVPEVVRHFDAEPIFADIDPDDYNIDLDALEDILAKNKSKKLKGAIINHVGGQPVDLDRLYDIAEKYNILIIEDASEAMGATYEGKKIGSTGADMTAFSFNPHMRSSISNGGMLVTDNEELNQRAELLRTHAIVTDKWDRQGNLGYIYDVIDIGLKYDMSELDAAYCIAQLGKVDKLIKRRIEIANIYNEELKDVPHVSLPIVKREHNYQLYIIKIDKNRDGFARELVKRGIYVGLHYIPLHLLSYYRQKYNLRVNDFPNALRNYQQILSIPIHAKMTDDDVYYVCEQIKDIAKKRSW
ncbi:DegT/DnrJ/EryC1/StrS family aminotransferase [Nitrosophilus alvini]|uniref:DegT/DnrJ/EryC1/StrS family aminotransferase n=1 Tax=Nitrosophilus alvini TaxID=2714855 RepID=UPI00190A7F73|nr:DegT/DnrJ/EryC1/StrS aminotransferase family protein [Nitrosophilus alvini]